MRTTAFAAVLMTLAAALPAAAQVSMPKPSGLPWASGMSNAPIAEFGRWRGRPVDLYTLFFGRSTWDHIRATGKSTPPAGVTPVLGYPMLPDTHRGQLAQCAAGAFDATIRVIRDTMLAHGWKGSWIRLGWEANRVEGGGTGWAFPWAALVADRGYSYTQCFRRWAKILNPYPTKNFVMVWHMGTVGSFPYPIEKLWPGGDVVDVVASDAYDRCPTVDTDEQWNARLVAQDKWGNPSGLAGWMTYARLKSKPFAVPEWGIGGSQTACRNPGKDNPFFIRKMHEVFKTHAGALAFESYFDHHDSDTGTHAIYPPEGSANPLSAATYRELW